MKKYTFFVAFLIILLLTGCSSNKTVKNELNMAISSSPLTADPQMLYDVNSSTVCGFFCSTLYVYNSEKKLIPGLAENYEVSDDGLKYTFHLKDNLKWSDGRALTAEDFVYGFKRLSDPDVGSNSVYLITDCCKLKNSEDILERSLPLDELGVSAPDNNTFIAELEEPCTYFLDLLTMANFTPCNEAFFHSTGGKYGSSFDTVLSCGPYVLDRYEPLATQIHFKKNPYYFDSDSIYLDGVNIQVIANAQQALMCYEAGDIDILNIDGELLELTDTDPELNIFTSASLFYVSMNQISANTALQNRNIRMALSKSIDRKDIAENLLKSGNAPMTRIIPPGFYYETDGTDFAADQDTYYEYAGYDTGAALSYWNSGLSEIGTSSVNLELVFANSYTEVAEVIASQMEKNLPGLKIKLKSVPFKERIAIESSGEYDLVLSGWNADYSDPTSFLALFLASFDDSYYKNQKYDDEYMLSSSPEMTKNPENRNVVLHRVEDIIMEDAGVIPVYTKGNTYLIRSNIKGFQMTPTGVGIVVTGIKLDN